MGKVKGKRGRNARRARQGQLGLSKSSLIEPKKAKKPFGKRQERREESKDARKDAEDARDALRNELAGVEKKGKNDEKKSRLPHTFVIHSGNVKIGKYARRLERDLRRLLEPHTSSQLRVLKRNNFKDFVVQSQSMGVTHLMALSRSEHSLNLRLIRNPQGPTLHFRVEQYSLLRDVLASQRRPVVNEEIFQTAPLLVLTGFQRSGEPGMCHLKLVQALVQTMFPCIDVDTVKLSTVKRVVLAHFDEASGLLEIRHYAVKMTPAGLSRPVGKVIIKGKKVPDLSRYKDITDFLLNPGALSESEYEGEEKVELDLPQSVDKKGKISGGGKTKIRLVEIGPRLSLRLVKIEEEINGGEVLYHAVVTKNAKEVAALKRKAPTIKKRRLRQEKQVEHATIRKLKAHHDEMRQEEKRLRKEKREKKERQADGDVEDDNYDGEEDDEQDGVEEE